MDPGIRELHAIEEEVLRFSIQRIGGVLQYKWRALRRNTAFLRKKIGVGVSDARPELCWTPMLCSRALLPYRQQTKAICEV